MKNKQAMPDLNSVNRALDELANESRGIEDPFVTRLQSLALKMTLAEKECKELLAEAMLNRDRGRYEMCRGGCIQIVKNCASKPDTKVYAYNILSTQASPGQAVNFLNESAKIVALMEEGSEKAKLKKTIGMLYGNAIVKDGPKAAAKAGVELVKLAAAGGGGEAGDYCQKSENGTPAAPSEVGEWSSRFEGVANSSYSRDLTPMSKKIIKWSGADAEKR